MYQIEKCPTTGRPHRQGYLELLKPERLDRVKRYVGHSAHLEVRQGTREQARNYCMKLESRLEGPWEFGKFEEGGQGRRSDILQAVNNLKENKSIRKLINDCPIEYVKYHNGFEKMVAWITPKRMWKTEVIFVIGDSDSGKTRYCWENYPNAYPKNKTKWWDMYDGEEDIIIAEFWGFQAEVGREYLLELFDRYPMIVEAKGKSIQMIAKRIVCCCRILPYDEADFEMRRRIDKIVTKCNEVVGNTGHNL